MNLPSFPETALQLALAVLVGGLIGAEREYHDKSAGFRTMIFICVGSTLFTILSIRIGVNNDPARIAAQIVSGVGFLGAGAILRDSGRLIGLTTAATIWALAALGMGIGSGHYALTLAGTALILIVLWAFPRLIAWIDPMRDARNYSVAFELGADTLAQVEAVFAAHKLKVRNRSLSRKKTQVTCVFNVIGPRQKHISAAEQIFAMPDVLEFRQ